MSMRIFGVDPSLTGTGLCCLDVATEEIIAVDTIASKLKGVSRLNEIREYVSNFILKNTDTKILTGKDTIEVFIEGYAFGARGRGIFNLGELGGILRLLLAKDFYGYYEVPPTVLKKFITGRGNVNKNVVLEQCFRRFGVGSDVLKDDNQVDAFGLAKLGVTVTKNNADKSTLELLGKIGPKCFL